MSADIHYEVFIKAHAKASWRLVEARDQKKDALELGHALLKKSPEASVRVSKEKWDPALGVFRSYTVFESGEKFSEEARIQREGELPCLTPADLCTPHARETIGRALKEWLRRQVATPLELLHRADLVEKLEASGTDFQHAVQKVAIATAASQQANVQKLVKQINDLATRAIEALYAADRAEAFPGLQIGGLGEIAEQIAKGANKDFRLRGAIATCLKDAVDWRDKLSRAIDLAEEAAAIVGPNGEWALELVGEYLVDLVEDEAARPHLLTVSGDLGDELDALTDMLRGAAQPRHSEPGQKLCAAFGAGRFIDAQRSIARHVLGQLQSPKRLKPGRIREEIDLNRSIADRLIMLVARRVISQEELVEAFVYRSGRLLDGDAIESLLDTAANPGEELFSLVELEDNIVGEANKAKLAGVIRSRLSGMTIEGHFLRSGEATRRLAELAALRATIDAGTFAREDAVDLGVRLDRFAVEIESKIKLFDQVVRRAGAALPAAAALLQLIEKGLVPKGRLAAEARARARALHVSPEAQAAARSGDPEQAALALSVSKMLGDAPAEGAAA